VLYRTRVNKREKKGKKELGGTEKKMMRRRTRLVTMNRGWEEGAVGRERKEEGLRC
jgi:hypothetical protein